MHHVCHVYNTLLNIDSTWNSILASSVGARIFRLPGHSQGMRIETGAPSKICDPSLFLVEASSYTVRTNDSTHGKNNSFM